MRQKQGYYRKLKHLLPTAASSIKHSSAPSQIDIKPQTKILINSVPITQYIMHEFQQKIARHAKSQDKTQSEQAKQA